MSGMNKKEKQDKGKMGEETDRNLEGKEEI